MLSVTVTQPWSGSPELQVVAEYDSPLTRHYCLRAEPGDPTGARTHTRTSFHTPVPIMEVTLNLIILPTLSVMRGPMEPIPERSTESSAEREKRRMREKGFWHSYISMCCTEVYLPRAEADLLKTTAIFKALVLADSVFAFASSSAHF
ncbi:hypothetical protein IRJ41_011613, partial [Triplophysa rosa]